MKIIFVGIHNKPKTTPLDSKTKSGKLIDKIIVNLKYFECIKTNLFDLENIPSDEIFLHQNIWLNKYKPKKEDIIILLGSKVQNLFPLKQVKSKIINVKHPSAIWSKKSQEEYVNEIVNELKV